MKENKNGHQSATSGELIEKAIKIMLDYNQATGRGVCVYDKDYNAYFPETQEGFCPEKEICSRCADPRSERGLRETCQQTHINAIKEAARKGSFHIYQCEMGFIFWTSSIYTDGCFSGAVRGSGFSPAGKKTVDILLNANDNSVMCNSEKTKDELKEHLKSYPETDGEKAQSLAEMMQLCAESLNSGNEDYHEIIRRRSEQQQTIVKIIEELKIQYGNDKEKPGYPLEKEKNLLTSLRKGESREAKKTLNEILAMIFFSNQSGPGESQAVNGFKFAQLRIIELVVLISRLEISPAKSGNLSMEINSQNLKLVQEAKTVEELTDIIHNIIDRVSGAISSFQGIPHAAALRKAENYILENYTRKISLKEIADIAGLSPPYFSTIFKEEMGENLSKYLNRLRVEKAGRLLLETEMSLSEIAARCCFEDQSWFSKIFKAYTGISPGKYRNQGGGTNRNT